MRGEQRVRLPTHRSRSVGRRFRICARSWNACLPFAECRRIGSNNAAPHPTIHEHTEIGVSHTITGGKGLLASPFMRRLMSSRGTL
jgi:hypothetical protein